MAASGALALQSAFELLILDGVMTIPVLALSATLRQGGEERAYEYPARLSHQGRTRDYHPP